MLTTVARVLSPFASPFRAASIDEERYTHRAGAAMIVANDWNSFLSTKLLESDIQTNEHGRRRLL